MPKRRRKRSERDELVESFDDDRVRAEESADVFMRGVLSGSEDETLLDWERDRETKAKKRGHWKSQF